MGPQLASCGVSLLLLLLSSTLRLHFVTCGTAVPAVLITQCSKSRHWHFGCKNPISGLFERIKMTRHDTAHASTKAGDNADSAPVWCSPAELQCLQHRLHDLASRSQWHCRQFYTPHRPPSPSRERASATHCPELPGRAYTILPRRDARTVNAGLDFSHSFQTINIIAEETRLNNYSRVSLGSRGRCVHFWLSGFYSLSLTRLFILIALKNKAVNSSVATSLSCVPAVTSHVGEPISRLSRQQS